MTCDCFFRALTCYECFARRACLWLLIVSARVTSIATLDEQAIMAVAGQHQAIIVSNAQQELLNWLLQQKQTPRIVCTDAPMADGILEGISRHGLH